MELLTTVSPSTIFSTYIQTFLGTQPRNNDVATVPLHTDITASGQTVQFTMQGLLGSLFGSRPMIQIGLGQGPFSVQTERFDTSADTMSAVTLQGHPLAGWRYWRAYSIGTNDVVVETGSVDTWGPSGKDFLGYWVFHYSQLKLWREYLQFILSDLRTRQNNGDPNAAQGINPAYRVEGVWNPGSPSPNDILYQVCQSSTCN